MCSSLQCSLYIYTASTTHHTRLAPHTEEAPLCSVQLPSSSPAEDLTGSGWATTVWTTLTRLRPPAALWWNYYIRKHYGTLLRLTPWKALPCPLRSRSDETIKIISSFFNKIKMVNGRHDIAFLYNLINNLTVIKWSIFVLFLSDWKLNKRCTVTVVRIRKLAWT